MTSIDPRKVQLAEKDIEDWLYENPQSLGVRKWIGRQFHVPSGIIDLLGVNEYNYPVVVEVKNVEIDADAILQVCRYAKDIQGIVSEKTNDGPFFYVTKIVVGRGGISSELQYEANAVNVAVMSFQVELSLSVSGPWRFTQEKMVSDYEMLLKILDNPAMDVFDNLITEETEGTEDKKPSNDEPGLEPFEKFLTDNNDQD
jgi:hypothetical protein